MKDIYLGGSGLQEASTDDQVPPPERLQREFSKSDIDNHYEWTRAHMWQYLSWIEANFGSLENFQKTISGEAQIKNDTDTPPSL